MSAMPDGVEPVRRLVEDEHLGLVQERPAEARAAACCRARACLRAWSRYSPRSHISMTSSTQCVRRSPSRSRCISRFSRTVRLPYAPAFSTIEPMRSNARTAFGRHARPEDLDPAVRGPGEREHHADRRGLAGAVAAEERVDLAAAHREREIVDRPHLPVVLGEPLGPDDDFGRPVSPMRPPSSDSTASGTPDEGDLARPLRFPELASVRSFAGVSAGPAVPAGFGKARLKVTPSGPFTAETEAPMRSASSRAIDRPRPAPPPGPGRRRARRVAPRRRQPSTVVRSRARRIAPSRVVHPHGERGHGLAVAQAVRHEVGQDPRDRGGVGLDEARVLGYPDVHRDAPSGELRLEAEDRATHGLGQIERTTLQIEVARVEAGRVEEVVGELGELVGLRADDREVALGLVAEPALQRVDVPGDRRDRRAQVVRDVGQQQPARLVAGRPRPPARAARRPRERSGAPPAARPRHRREG